MDIGLPNKKTPGSPDWQPHLLHNSGAPQGCALSPLLFTLYTATAFTDMERT